LIGATTPPPESVLSIASAMDYATIKLASMPVNERQTLIYKLDPLDGAN